MEIDETRPMERHHQHSFALFARLLGAILRQNPQRHRPAPRRERGLDAVPHFAGAEDHQAAQQRRNVHLGVKQDLQTFPEKKTPNIYREECIVIDMCYMIVIMLLILLFCFTLFTLLLILYCNVVYHVMLYYVTSYCSMSYHIALRFIIFHFLNILQYIVLYHIVLYRIM